MTNTIFLHLSQNFDYDINPRGKNIRDVVEYFLTHDMTHSRSFEMFQSDTGHMACNWGHIVYKADDKGVLSYYADKVDSSD